MRTFEMLLILTDLLPLLAFVFSKRSKRWIRILASSRMLMASGRSAMADGSGQPAHRVVLSWPGYEATRQRAESAVEKSGLIG